MERWKYTGCVFFAAVYLCGAISVLRCTQRRALGKILMAVVEALVKLFSSYTCFTISKTTLNWNVIILDSIQ